MCGRVPGRDSAGERVRWGRVSRNHLSGVNGVSQLNEQHRFGISLSWACCVRGELHKGKMAPASASIPREKCPCPCPSSTHPEINQCISSGISLAHFELLPLCQSLSQMSLCPCPLKAAFSVSCSPLSPWDIIPTTFHNQ